MKGSSRLLTWFQIQCLLRLIRKFLKAGYLEDWTFHNTFSGTPQGGIVSPILVNIYLDRLEEFMMGIHPEIWCGSHSDSQTFRGAQKSWFSEESGYAKLKTVTAKSERKKAVEQLNVIDRTRLQIPSFDEMDNGYKRLKYVRYADDFLIGVIGSKEDC